MFDIRLLAEVCPNPKRTNSIYIEKNLGVRGLKITHRFSLWIVHVSTVLADASKRSKIKEKSNHLSILGRQSSQKTLSFSLKIWPDYSKWRCHSLTSCRCGPIVSWIEKKVVLSNTWGGEWAGPKCFSRRLCSLHTLTFSHSCHWNQNTNGWVVRQKDYPR